MSQVNAAGVGYKMGNELTHMDIKTAADLRRISQEKLMQKFGERIGAFLYLACRGQVSSSVTMLNFTCLSNNSYNIMYDDNDIHNITYIISSIILYLLTAIQPAHTCLCPQQPICCLCLYLCLLTPTQFCGSQCACLM